MTVVTKHELLGLVRSLSTVAGWEYTILLITLW